MKKLTILPRILEGEITPPESKSLAHRGIIAAALADGISEIRGITDPSEDIIATKKAMEALGAKISSINPMIIDGKNSFKEKTALIDCNESGSTLRFLIPIVLAFGGQYKFIGRGLLGKRPLDPYYDIFKQDGIYYKNKSKNLLDLTVDGKLKGGEYRVAGNISSQFITGLLFALPLLKNSSKVIVTTPLESKGYVDLTLSVLKRFGILIENIEYKEFIIKGGQSYKYRRFNVEKDYSQAAFFLSAAAIGNDVKVKGMNLKSIQGDSAILDCLISFGAKFLINESENIIEITDRKLIGTEIDGSQFPDIVPILTVVAALSEGVTRINNISRLRIKESDRIEAITTEINKIGGNVRAYNDYMIIGGVEEFTGGQVDSWNDHRIAMSMAIASTRCEQPLTIHEADCVKKSYPNFFEDFKKLGGHIR